MTPWTAASQAFLYFTISQRLLRLRFIKSVMPSNRLSSEILFSLCLQSFPASGSFHVPIRWSMYWSFSFSISPSNEYSGLISFRMDWLNLLAVQGTLKSLLQHHSSKASILWCSAFFTVQLSHPYMSTGKTIALNRWTFVGKAMSLHFNSCLVLSQLFFQRASDFFMADHHLQWFWNPRKIKSLTVSNVSLSICHDVVGPDAMIFGFWILSFKPAFSLFSFTLSGGSLVPLSFLP